MKHTYAVYILFFSLFAGCILFPKSVFAARIYAVSAEQTISAGQTFVIDWHIDTEGSSINVVDGSMRFTTDILELAAITPADSVVSLWVENPKQKERGIITFSGGIPGGVTGTDLKLFRTTFKALRSGTAGILLGELSNVLHSDGVATQENIKPFSLQFSVVGSDMLPIVIMSPTHKNQMLWYRLNDVVIDFEKRNNELYSYSFSTNKEIIPGDIPIDTTGHHVFKNVPDGVYTFKLNTKVTDGSWQEAGVYRVQIDTHPPEDFTPLVSRDPTLFNNAPFVSFSTVDKVSGVASYAVSSGWFGVYRQATTPYRFKRPLVGDMVTVKAIDTAGNIRYATVPVEAYIPVWMFIAGIVLCMITSIFFYKKHS